MPKAGETTITRRGILGAAVSGAAVLAGSKAVLAETEHPWETARRLAGELADILRKVDNGAWSAAVHPTGTMKHPVTFCNVEAMEDAEQRKWEAYRKAAAYDRLMAGEQA